MEIGSPSRNPTTKGDRQNKHLDMEDSTKDILIYLPTNNCGRCLLFVVLNGGSSVTPESAHRHVPTNPVGASGLEDVCEVKKPADYGGLKSEDFLKINPMGKMPALISSDGTTVFESQAGLGSASEPWASAPSLSRHPDSIPGPGHP